MPTSEEEWLSKEFDFNSTMHAISPHPIERKGLALLEVIIAVGILTVAVVAITSAIVSGQQQSLEARTTIVASVAAESLLAKISQEPWESIDAWHGYTENIGEIVDATGQPIGGDWDSIGRTVSVIEFDVYIESLQVYLAGRTVSVTVTGADGRIVTSVQRFIPEPQS